MALFEDVWTRNFLNFFATPLRISEYLAGLVIVAVTTSLLSLVAMLVLAQVAFGLSFLTYGVALAPFLMVLFLTGIALGDHRRGARAAARTGLGVADLADPDADLAVRRRLLSGRGPARLDAGDREGPAAVLRVRGHARGRRRQARRPGIGWRSAAASRSSILCSPACSSSPSTAPPSAPA